MLTKLPFTYFSVIFASFVCDKPVVMAVVNIITVAIYHVGLRF